MYAYDAAADRARELRREIGLPSPTAVKPRNSSLISTPGIRTVPSPKFNITTSPSAIRI